MLVVAGAVLLTLMAVIFIQSTTEANSSGQVALSATVRGLGRHVGSHTLRGEKG